MVLSSPDGAGIEAGLHDLASQLDETHNMQQEAIRGLPGQAVSHGKGPPTPAA